MVKPGWFCPPLNWTSRILCIPALLFYFEAHSQDALFASDSLLKIRISGNLKPLLTDRGIKSAYHKVKLWVDDGSGSFLPIEVRVRTRGHFRKMNVHCYYPPLLLNFSKKNTPIESPFYGQDKVKLVTPCRDESYIAREYTIYKLYNLVTPKSFRARMVRLTLDDTIRRKVVGPMFGILLEEDQEMARRNRSRVIEDEVWTPEQLDKADFLTMAVFQFMIGNTDWSIQFRQNEKLIVRDSLSAPSAVPYDFDLTGFVEARYAAPPEELKMYSVRERRYRGYCLPNLKEYDETIQRYNVLKESFYGVIRTSPYLDERFMRSAIKYLDEFYKTINDPKLLARAFLYPCDPEGTGKVVIKGLKD